MLPGLNVGGAQVSVMPQFTPSNTAIDASGIGRGFSQGLGLVEQAQNARRLRDIIAEDQANAPLRQAQRLRNLELAQAPIQAVAGIETQVDANGNLIEVENVEAFVPGGQPYKFQRPTRVLETAAQSQSRIDTPRGFAPDVKYMPNEEGGTDAVYLDRNPGREGMELRRVKGVIPPQSFVPPPPKPTLSAAEIVDVPTDGGGVRQVALVKDQEGNRFYRDEISGELIPFRSAPAVSTGEESSIMLMAEWSAYAQKERAAGRKPLTAFEWRSSRKKTTPASGANTTKPTQPGPVTAPAPTRIRYGYDATTGTWGLKPSTGQ